MVQWVDTSSVSVGIAHDTVWKRGELRGRLTIVVPPRKGKH